MSSVSDVFLICADFLVYAAKKSDEPVQSTLAGTFVTLTFWILNETRAEFA